MKLGSLVRPGDVRRSDLPQYDLSARPYSLRGDDYTDNSPALTAILADLPDRVELRFGKRGVYRFSIQHTIAKSYVRISGQGRSTTTLKYTGGAGSFLTANAGAGLDQFGFGVHDLTLSATDTSASKTALDLVDVRSAMVNNIAIAGWSGGDSIGIKTRGREFLKISKCRIGGGGGASQLVPILIAANPNTNGWLSADFFSVEDCELIGQAAPATLPWAAIVISDTAQINKTDLNRIVLIGGRYGLYWAATTVAGHPSDSLNIRGVRKEQTPAAQTNPYSIFIDLPTGGLRSLRIEDFTGELSASNPSGGLYSRGTQDISITNFNQQGGAVSAINVDAESLTVDNLNTANNAIVTVGANMRLATASHKAGRSHPSSATWKNQGPFRDGHQPALRIGDASVTSYWADIPDDGTLTLPLSGNNNYVGGGIVEVYAYNYASPTAVYGLFGLSLGPIGTNGVRVLVDPDSACSASDTDGKLCLYSTGPNPLNASVILRNRLGAPMKILVIARYHRTSNS